ncbi:hypothetical protein ACN6K9_004070 [Streptomyces sp. SAS_267]|uniref:hypothetical protein n=1 Tax=Streptomyces sp. SAS_267 TaxID=3412750 RepID=UPI00403C51B0
MLQIKDARQYVYTRLGSPLTPMIREVGRYRLADYLLFHGVSSTDCRAPAEGEHSVRDIARPRTEA